MRKINLALISAFILLNSSCSSNEDPSLALNQDSESYAKTRTIEDAVTLANKVSTIDTRSRGAKIATMSDVKVVTSHPSRSGEVDTLFYAVNYPDREGFALIAAPTNVTPLLAVTDKGCYTDEEFANNPQMSIISDAVSDYVEAKSIIKPDTVPMIREWYTESIEGATQGKYRLTVRWGQYWPENIYCPNEVGGCLPIAIAQICSYFQSPTALNLTFSERTTDSITLDWSDILKHTQSVSKEELEAPFRVAHETICSSLSHKAIANLVRQIGEDANATYYSSDSTSHTSVSSSKAFPTLAKYQPDRQFKTGTEIDSLYEYLSSTGVALVLGYDADQGGGHAWVADGSWDRVYKTWYYVYDSVTGSYKLDKIIDESGNYLHYNWGWDGDCNGFFLSGIFNTKQGGVYDDGVTKNHSYNLNYYISFAYLK